MNEVMITVVGNVVADPELSTTRNGLPVANFRLASTSRRYDKEAGGWTNGETLYISVRCWRGLAQNVASSISKGSPVIVQGRLYTRTATIEGDSGPRRRHYTDLEATAVGLDLARLPMGGALTDDLGFLQDERVAA
jgi:single-strand DNA-binding protein